MSVALGIDVQSIDEVRSSIECFGERYVQRVFEPSESEHAREHPVSASAYLAARFAAREAVSKLLEFEEVFEQWRNIHVLEGDRHEWRVRLTGDALLRAEYQGISEILLSVDYVRDFATAVALADIDQHTCKE